MIYCAALQVDAFTDEPFKGNTAAVCLLEESWEEQLDEQWMQSVAAEFNTSITAFLVRADADAANPQFHIRWFTPVREVRSIDLATNLWLIYFKLFLKF
jgi:PhzF family phenazine biosynthesis protein